MVHYNDKQIDKIRDKDVLNDEDIALERSIRG